MSCIGNGLLCVTAVTVVCSSEIYCAECWSWVLHVIREKVQVTFVGRYFPAGGQWYCRLNRVCYSESYLEGTSQQVDSGIAAWMECVTVKVIWKVLHSRWTVVLPLEQSVLQWKLSGRYCIGNGHLYCSLNRLRYNFHQAKFKNAKTGHIWQTGLFNVWIEWCFVD